ncbi:MAG TPA: hypothetical protein VFW98_15950 [Gemmatimonadaceae bacterium]|nr:hypothetical protein [Gemmatimonadaceae bacterium]
MSAPRVVSREALTQALDYPRLIDEIAEGFIAYSAGRVVVPPVGHLGFRDPPGDVHIKYGYVRGDDVYVIKVASGFEENALAGLPPGDGLMLVFGRQTGTLRAVLLDGGWLTDVRTAAAGAVVARALAPRTVERIGVIGTGVQARLQLEFLSYATPCREVMVYGRTPAHTERFVQDMAARGFHMTSAASPDALAAACNLIVTATTAKAPLFRADEVRAGTHVSAFGADAPGKQELDVELFRRADCVVADSRSQTTHHGELAHALAAGTVSSAAVRELGEVLADPSLGRTSDAQITLADLTGVAVQDIVVAKHVLAGIAAPAIMEGSTA